LKPALFPETFRKHFRPVVIGLASAGAAGFRKHFTGLCLPRLGSCPAGGFLSSDYIASLPGRRPGEDSLAVISVNGKTSRAAGVHVLNVFLHDLQLVLYQAPVADKQSEISAFKEALAGLLTSCP
jgi:hypothetical protein